MKYFFLLLIIGLTSCQSEEQMLSVSFSGASKIEILDLDGQNRLNPDHSDPILLDNLNLYHLIDGERKLYYDGDMETPKGMQIFFDDYHKKWVLRVAQNVWDQNDELITTSVIDFGDSVEGIIDAKWNQSTNPPGPGALYMTKVWYNGELVHEGRDHRIFSIIK